ncbi:MAG: hypothetical protein ACMXYF_04580 [Candidatus Woesearchaeota archaeon]
MPKDDIGFAPLRYRGLCDLEKIYRTTVKWMKQNNFKVFQNSYKDKVSGPGVSEIEIKFESKLKVDEYHRCLFKFVLKTWDTQKVQTEDGKMLYNGRIDINIKGSIETDWQGAYDGKTTLRDLMGKVVYNLKKNDPDQYYEDWFRERIYELQEQIKQIIGIQT